MTNSQGRAKCEVTSKGRSTAVSPDLIQNDLKETDHHALAGRGYEGRENIQSKFEKVGGGSAKEGANSGVNIPPKCASRSTLKKSMFISF